MVKVMIHACEPRMWYVNEFLLPSLKEQGCEDIRVICDTDHVGNVEACMRCFAAVKGEEHTWHLQDDVVLAEDFKERAELYESFNGIVCGIKTRYDAGKQDNDGTPRTDKDQMWLSFPCIRIPDILARGCAHTYNTQPADFFQWKQRGRGDDMVFRKYIKKCCPSAPYINAIPNMVDHIDYLIGNTTSTQKLPAPSRAVYFDKTIADKLAIKISQRGNLI